MKEYLDPELVIVRFDVEDVIASSVTAGGLPELTLDDIGWIGNQ